MSKRVLAVIIISLGISSYLHFTHAQEAVSTFKVEQIGVRM